MSFLLVNRIAESHVDRKIKELVVSHFKEGKEHDSETFLEFALTKTKMSRKEVTTFICDALVAGVDTVRG